jgi:hypothetical protein
MRYKNAGSIDFPSSLFCGGGDGVVSLSITKSSFRQADETKIAALRQGSMFVLLL